MRFTAEVFRQRISEQLPLTGPSQVEEDGLPVSQAVDLSRLYGQPDNESFLREAYREVLGREADAYGFVRYREMLRHHIPRSVILRSLIHSEEARLSGRRFTGLQEIRGAAGRFRSGIRTKLRSTIGTIFLGTRNLLELLMQGWRFELLDVKMETLKEYFAAESARAYHHAEERFCQLSEKLDSYVADLRSNQQAIVEAITRQERRLGSMDRWEAHERILQDGLKTQSARAADASSQLGELRTLIANGLGDAEARSSLRQQRLNNVLGAFQAELVRQLSELRDFAANDLTQAEARATLRERLLQDRLDALDDTFVQRLGELRGLTTQTLSQAEARSALYERTLENGLGRFRTSLDAGIGALAGRIRPPAVAGAGNVVATEVEGFIIGVPAEEWRLAAYQVFRGPLEPGLLRAFRRAIQPGMTVVDVGANIGVFTLAAAKLTGPAGRVISFEPTPRIFAILRDNIQINGFLETGIIDLRQTALRETAGRAPFNVYPADSGHCTLFAGPPGATQIVVETDTLDCALAAIPRVDVIKIDAEGAEPFILRGMRRLLERSPLIRLFIEFAPELLQNAGVVPAAFLEELTEAGFERLLVDDLTGDLRTATHDELLRGDSMNLSLTRRSKAA